MKGRIETTTTLVCLKTHVQCTLPFQSKFDCQRLQFLWKLNLQLARGML